MKNVENKLFGRLSVVSTGPGSLDYIAPAALEAVKNADVVVGYKSYIDLILPLLEGKEIVSNGMRAEVERCRAAVEYAREGKNTVLISGGDAGVYGLSGLILELVDSSEAENVVVIPGITSATACASILGAPLIHDFAVISLSDLLTESSLIEKRLEAAAQADFAAVIYNPKSRKRKDLFYKTCSIFLKYRAADTPVGLVKNAYRDGQKVKIIRLSELEKEEWVDMRTTVIIGNSSSFEKGGRIITPRGYNLS
jgi:precorrin-3B C17-methyltransferase